MKRFFHIVFRITGLLLLLLVVLAALLQTPKGKELIASSISSMASHQDHVQVRVGRIRGWVPLDMSVDRIEVGDAEGTWLAMQNLRGRWMLRDLFAGRIRVAKLGADEIELVRFPATGGGSNEKRRETGSSHIPCIVLEGWSVDRLKLGPALAGVPLEYSIRSGGIFLIDGSLSGDLEISGDAEGSVEIMTDLANAADPSLVLRAELKEMRKPTFGMDRLSGSLNATIAPRGIDAVVQAEIIKDDVSGHVSSRLHYASRKLKLEAFGFEGNGLSTDGNLELAFSNGRIDLDVNASVTDRKQRPYTLSGTAAIGTSNKTWSVSIPSMTVRAWDAVSMTLSGRCTPMSIDLTAKLAEFTLDAVPYPFASNYTGRVDGSISIRGTPEAPQVDAALEVKRFTTSSATLNELPKMDFLIAAGLADGRLSASVSLTNSVRGYLVADASIPCMASLDPLRFDAEYRKVDAKVDAFFDMDVFNGLAMLDNQYVKGLLTAELDVNAGIPSGVVYLEDASYEHYAWGILFRDFNGRLESSEEGFVLRNAHATDGGSGRLVLTGGMSHGILDVSLDLARARVIRRPELEAMISGHVGVTGPYAHPDVKGRLVVDHADLLPDNIVSAAPPVLENFDIEIQTSAQSLARQRKPLPFGMDINLDMPDQVYINASLINSVWGGVLRLRDTPDGLSIKGRIEPRRGYVDFIGKQFRFLDGAVELDSAVQPVPVMNNLTAEYSRSDISALLVLNGSVINPQFSLTSTPALPQDEILSQVLFKRDASSISPYQAVQITLAARQLSGGLSGPGFLYQFRQAVGMDTLEWREPESEEQGSSVAAGKYLTPELYVEVSSTLGSEVQTDMTAEYEINRHFSVETSAGPKLRPGIGLNWKNDY